MQNGQIVVWLWEKINDLFESFAITERQQQGDRRALAVGAGNFDPASTIGHFVLHELIVWLCTATVSIRPSVLTAKRFKPMWQTSKNFLPFPFSKRGCPWQAPSFFLCKIRSTHRPCLQPELRPCPLKLQVFRHRAHGLQCRDWKWDGKKEPQGSRGVSKGAKSLKEVLKKFFLLACLPQQVFDGLQTIGTRQENIREIP